MVIKRQKHDEESLGFHKQDNGKDQEQERYKTKVDFVLNPREIERRKRPRLGITEPTKAEEISAWFTRFYEETLYKYSRLELYSQASGFLRESFLLNGQQLFFSTNDMLNIISSKQKRKRMVIIVCSAARRACAVLKELVPIRLPVAKLFAKHMKLKEQVDFLERVKPSVAVGTPNRILSISQTKALDFMFHKDCVIFLDRHLDVKKYSLLTAPIIALDCFEFIRTMILSIPFNDRPLIGFFS